MTDLLTRDEIAELQEAAICAADWPGDYDGLKKVALSIMPRICRDYLTLLGQNEELGEHHERFVKMVARDLSELTQELKRL